MEESGSRSGGRGGFRHTNPDWKGYWIWELWSNLKEAVSEKMMRADKIKECLEIKYYIFNGKDFVIAYILRINQRELKNYT